MDADTQLLARVLKQQAFLEPVLLNDISEDWNLVKDLGEFLVRVFPEDIIGHALLVRACRHTGDIRRAIQELTVCRGYIDRHELTRKQVDLFTPMLEREEIWLDGFYNPSQPRHCRGQKLPPHHESETLMHHYTVELRIFGSNVDTDQVTKSLGLSPTQVRKKGEQRSPGSTWKSNMWAFEVVQKENNEWSSLADGLSALVDKFGPIQDRLRSYASANELYVWCGHFSSSFGGGPTLPPDLLKKLGEFGAQLVLDTYCERPNSRPK